jgi:hypothetical protein
MTTIEEDHLLGFYASFHSGEADQEVVRSFLWGPNGLKAQLNALKWQNYGQDLHLILFQCYVKPMPYLRDSLKEIGNYRRSEKSIAIPIILDQGNFFDLTEVERLKFFHSAMLERLQMLKEKVRRNKLDLDIEKLILDGDHLIRDLIKQHD